MKEERRASHQRYLSLFENMPISLWEEDFSAVKIYIDSLRTQGVEDFRSYFENNHWVVSDCAEMVRIIDVNQATLNLYQAESKDELLHGLSQVCKKETYGVFEEELIALIKGHTRFESEALTRTMTGNEKHVYLTLSVAPGHEDTWSRVLLSISDITKRKKMEEELKSSHEYLEKLNNSLQEVIFTVRMPERAIVYVNRAIQDVFGYKPDECIGKTTRFLYPTMKEYNSFGDKLESTIKDGKDALHTECPLKRKNGEVFPAEITTTFFREEGKITQVISIVRDISARKLGQEALKESEARLIEAQRIAHLGNWNWDIIKNELIWSDEIYRIFGLTPQKFGATYEAFLNSVHPDDREFAKQSVNEALYERKPYSIDHRVVLPDGSKRVVHEEAEVVFDKSGKPVRMAGTVHDVTTQKQIEDELRALSHRLVEVQEEERRAIARELHDQVGQSLTALKLLLAKAMRSPVEDIAPSLSQAKAVVSEIMAQVRDLSLDLLPSMLDDLGLLPTLIWHFDRFKSQANIRVNFRHASLDRYLPPEISTTAYRIVQEALTNVARHAGVNEVDIHAWTDDTSLFLRIDDRGIGFDPTKLPAGASRGLSGMKERVLLLGGKLTIDTAPGAGTRITVELPLPAKRRRRRKERPE